MAELLIKLGQAVACFDRGLKRARELSDITLIRAERALVVAGFFVEFGGLPCRFAPDLHILVLVRGQRLEFAGSLGPLPILEIGDGKLAGNLGQV